MCQYEKYDLCQLQDNPSLDPDDPEVLYAMAQCFRQGKGVEPDEKIARELLQQAARAGSGQAQAELAQAESASACPRLDYDSMTPGELKQLAESGDLRANLDRYRKCRKLKDWKEAERCLSRCVEEATMGQQNLLLRQEALEEAGAFYWQENLEESRRLYELARELGSTAACGVLLDYYTQGIGGQAVPELAAACARQLEKRGTPEDLFQFAVWHTNQNKRSPSIDAQEALEEVVKKTKDPLLKARAQARLHFWHANPEVPCQDFLPALWAACGQEDIQNELTMLYVKEPDLPVEPGQARFMARACPQLQNYWLGRAEQEKTRQEAAPSDPTNHTEGRYIL